MPESRSIDHLYIERARCLQEDPAVSADSGCSFSGHSAETDKGPCDQRSGVLLDQSDEVILAPDWSPHQNTDL